jgi:2-desacetyl-2-hydroxyethyl bacteriochlorophyllide A dehydrogenase
MTGTSIVVRGFNEEKHIGALLEGIRAQNYRDAEIILVDSGSTDLTRQVAAPYIDRLIQIPSRDFTFGYSLNVGCDAASGDSIVMVSAHTKPVDLNWLGNLIGNLSDPHVAMGFGRQSGTPTSKYSESRDFSRTFNRKRQLLAPSNYFVNNANSVIRRDLWREHHFDETLPGLEDAEWAKYWMACGYQVIYDPTAAIYHIHEESWRQVRIRYHREAAASRQIGISSRRQLPEAFAKEVSYAVADILSISSRPARWNRVSEILRFRWNKAAGTASGLWATAPLLESSIRDESMFNREARAVVIERAKHSKLTSVEIPQVNPGGALIKVAYVGLCATDIEVLDGTLSYFQTGLATYPIIPGHEFSGQVMAVGAAVPHLSEGDHVVVETVHGCGDCDHCRSGNRTGCVLRTEIGVFGLSGAYADYIVVPGTFVHKIPPTLRLKTAALCEPLSVVMKGLRRLDPYLPMSSSVAVIGAGSIGHLATRALAHRGHAVTVFDRDQERLHRLEDVATDLRTDMNGLDEFSVVIEATGNTSALNDVIDGTLPGATILLLGLPYSGGTLGAEHLVSYDKTLIGSVGAGPQDLDEAISMIGVLNVDALLQTTLPLESYQRGWEMVRNNECLKVMLEIDPLIEHTASLEHPNTTTALTSD